MIALYTTDFPGCAAARMARRIPDGSPLKAPLTRAARHFARQLEAGIYDRACLVLAPSRVTATQIAEHVNAPIGVLGRSVVHGLPEGAELANAYRQVDLFLFPSVHDTLGQVVLEAMASGLPVIVTDRGGPQELVRSGHDGIVCPPDRLVELAAALRANNGPAAGIRPARSA